jgi:hypothetical protein
LEYLVGTIVCEARFWAGCDPIPRLGFLVKWSDGTTTIESRENLKVDLLLKPAQPPG